MTFAEWLIHLLGNGIEVISKKWITWGKEEDCSPYISSGTWVTGGMGGGSCWGDVASPRGSDDEPEFKQLDKLLELVWPDISHLKYKRLVSELVTKKETTSYEYYGNYTEESEKRIDLLSLYDWLKEQGQIDS